MIDAWFHVGYAAFNETLRLMQQLSPAKGPTTNEMQTIEEEQATHTAPAEKPAPQLAPIGVMICTPMREFRGLQDLPPQIGSAIKELVGREDARGYTWEFAAAVGGLCRARNNCVDEFLKSPNKFLLWWDRDLHQDAGRNAEAILRLLAHRQPIVGGLYCKRVKRPTWVATFMPAAKLQSGLLQCAELGGGFKLYHRKVFEELRRIFGTEPLAKKANSILYRERETGEMIAGFYQNLVDHGDLLSEDYFLDALCRAAHIPIFADTLVKMRHVDGASSFPEGAWPPIPAEDAK